jgi:hypothetical protein
MVGNSCGNSAASTLTITLTGADGGSQTFSSGVQSFTVPTCISTITISAYGAQGGNGLNCASKIGGNGAYVTGTFSVTPGHILNIIIGEMGGR